MKVRIVSKSMGNPSRAKMYVRSAAEVAEILGGQILDWGNTISGEPKRGGKFVSVVSVEDKGDLDRLHRVCRQEWPSTTLTPSVKKTVQYNLCITLG